MQLAGRANSSSPRKKEPNSSVLASFWDGACWRGASIFASMSIRAPLAYACRWFIGCHFGNGIAVVGAIDQQLASAPAAQGAKTHMQAALFQVFLRCFHVFLAHLQAALAGAGAKHAGAAGQHHFDVGVIGYPRAHQAQQRRHGLADVTGAHAALACASTCWRLWQQAMGQAAAAAFFPDKADADAGTEQGL